MNRVSRTVVMTLGLTLPVAGASLGGAPAAAVSRQAPVPPGMGSVLDRVYSEDQADQGRKTYQSACASCHTLKEQVGRRFSGRWKDRTVGDVVDLISNTMPDGNPNSLTPDEYVSIVAFYLRETGYPAGAHDLPLNLDELKKIRILPPATP